MDVFYNENNPHAAQWLRNLIDAGHLPTGAVDGRSIVDVGPEDCGETSHFFAGIGGWPYALRLAGWPDEWSVWTGSCPCQPFSCAGKAGSVGDKRHLWPAFRGLIAERSPSVVFGEQVADGDGRRWFAGVRVDLEGMGYAVGAANLCAASVGAPHIRQRIFFVAHASGINGKPHDCMGQSGARGAQEPTRRFPRVSVAGGGWTTDTRPERMPTLVRNHDGLSAILEGFGNAIVPQVAAKFVRAFMSISGARCVK